MSKVCLEDVEIKQLKEKNNQVQQENKTLQEKVSKHKIKLRGQLPLQGAKHFLWDLIAIEITKFWEYVYFIEEKDALTSTTLLKFEIVNETLQKKPMNKAQNAINFLSQTSNSTLATLGVKDRFSIIIWAKRFLEKHKLVNNVHAKAKQMDKGVKHFKETFKKKLKKGFPPSRIILEN